MNNRSTFSFENNSNENIQKELNNQRLEHKLSLRKIKYNNLFNLKRNFSSMTNNKENINLINNTKEKDNAINPNIPKTITNNSNNCLNNIKWKLELSIDNIPIPEPYKKNFSSSNEMIDIDIAISYLECVDTESVRYGLCLLKDIFKKENINQKALLYIDAFFIHELILTIEEYCFKKEKDIVFNIYYFLNNYILINKHREIIEILLDQEAFKVFELSFILQDDEIICQLIILLNNICSQKQEYKISIICSSFLSDTFIKLFRENKVLKAIIENMDDKKNLIELNKKLNLYKLIIEKGILLFSNLIDIQSRNINSSYKNKFTKGKQLLLEIFISFLNTKSKSIQSTCMISIYKVTNTEPGLFETLDKSNFIENMLSQSNDYSDKVKIYYNRILGNYIAYKEGLSHEFFMKVIKYELDLLFSFQDINLIVKEILWVFTNVILDDIQVIPELFDDEKFMSAVIHYYRGINNCKDVNDASEFIRIFISHLDAKRFNMLLNNGLIEICCEQGKILFEEDKNYYEVFTLFEEMLNVGEKYRSQYEGNNMVLEKLEIMGMKELFEKNIENKFEQISKICENICEKYFDLKTEIEF